MTAAEEATSRDVAGLDQEITGAAGVADPGYHRLVANRGGGIGIESWRRMPDF
jgi:hypothetical protein